MLQKHTDALEVLIKDKSDNQITTSGNNNQIMNIGDNSNVHINNTTFNLNNFLLVTCKNAPSFDEFLKNIKIPYSLTTNLAKKNTELEMTKYISAEFDKIPVHLCSLHCVDTKRGIFYENTPNKHICWKNNHNGNLVQVEQKSIVKPGYDDTDTTFVQDPVTKIDCSWVMKNNSNVIKMPSNTELHRDTIIDVRVTVYKRCNKKHLITKLQGVCCIPKNGFPNGLLLE